MHLFRSKKGMSTELVIALVLLVVSFLLISRSIMYAKEKSEGEMAVEMCEGSVDIRENAKLDLWYTPETHLTPLLCNTVIKEIPSTGETKEEIMKELADAMARCWDVFGEGNYKNVFDGTTFKNKCFILYEVNLVETDEFKESDPILINDFTKYFATTPYKGKETTDSCWSDGGFCETEAECKARNVDRKYWKFTDDDNDKCGVEKDIGCCHSTYTCLNNGGICEEKKPSTGDYGEYSKWKCPSKKKCYVKNENFYTYESYVKSYGYYKGLAVTGILEGKLVPGEKYAIAFGSPTSNCGEYCLYGALPGIATAGVGILIIAGGAVASSSLIGAPAGAAMIGVGVKVTAVGIGAAIVGSAGVKGVAELVNLFKERKVNTVYFAKYNEISGVCDVIVE